MAPGLRDIFILLAAVTVAIVAGAVLRFFLPARLEAVLGVGLLLAACAAVKFWRPGNVFMRGVSWTYFAMVAIIVEGVVLLLSDFSILGYWTIPSAIGLGLLYCVLHLVLVGDDGRRRSR